MYQYHKDEGRFPIKMWTDGVPVEESAMQQLKNISSMPFIHKHVAVMPDVHWGRGATIGSVIATKGAVIPAAVGVDLGCGMVAIKTNMKSTDLPESLAGIRSDIEAAIPHGRTDNGGKNDKGGWQGDMPDDVVQVWKGFDKNYQRICEKHPKARAFNNVSHIGTLGTGNHFIEICLDEDDAVWIMLHSGSRGLGNRIGTYFIQLAKKDMERWFINLPDKDLAYIPEGSELFDDYVDAVHFAQDYAFKNRIVMLERVKNVLRNHLRGFEVLETAVNCHHNYISRENHFGANVIVTRKGAVRARTGDLGIIPGSMGARSYIVRGKGNPESFCSCSHGAGRTMSRGEANKKITLEEHARATHGVECRKDVGVLDESPAAYKDIDAVMNAQKDLVDVVAVLKQIVCVKG